MNAASRPIFWTRPRLIGTAMAFAVIAVFAGANAHLVVVSVTSQSDCVLPSSTEGAAAYRAAKPSC